MNEDALIPAQAEADENLKLATVAFPDTQGTADARIVAAAFRETILRAQRARAATETQDQSPILDV